MDWSISNIVGIGLRLLSNRKEIAAVAGKAADVWSEARDVVEKVAPDLLRDMGMTARLEAPKPHAFDVEWVQQALNHLLHPQGVKLKVDGVMGEQTRKAIMAYQAKRGLKVDGWMGVLTLAALEQDIQQAHAGAGR